ncbi:unnamed protein product [Cyprideis torosa]|uniref:Xylulose kinase n=1 Tax=Cyprideis torosa TaxID=163714 RepID=A0A7R8ZKW7_9CRUS|nr:unnamed protein product [Cyprideis torosa]CAG0890373.1 unnamed protein product [Cyprideis torosa]
METDIGLDESLPVTESLFLGLDFSTQQIKAVVINYEQEVQHEASVQFDNDFPEYRTHGGVLVSTDDNSCVTAPVQMWVKAVDVLLDKLRIEGVDFSKISALSGAAQQHGTVYWKKGTEEILKSLDPTKFLHLQLDNRFTEKLGPPVFAGSVLGNIGNYFVERYGFDEGCKVVAFTGDNPSSLAALCLRPGDVAISLGTSDVVFVSMNDFNPCTSGGANILAHPFQEDAIMGLLCFKNGSVPRDRIKTEYTGDDWKIFSQLLDCSPPGNYGNIGFFFDNEEIIPPYLQGNHFFNTDGVAVSRFTSNEVYVRALVEGQFLSRRLHAQRIGFTCGPCSRVLATGGASQNTALLQVMSDVFNSPVYTMDVFNSAALGAAYRAKSAMVPEKPFLEAIKEPVLKLVCTPVEDAAIVYSPMLARYAKLEGKLIAELRHGPENGTKG